MKVCLAYKIVGEDCLEPQKNIKQKKLIKK